MRNVLVRYRVHPGRGDENAALVREVYAELARTAPSGFRYATFVLEDGVSFVHLAAQADEGPGPLADNAAFAAFRAGLPERCAEPPSPATLTLVGSYRLLDDA